MEGYCPRASWELRLALLVTLEFDQTSPSLLRSPRPDGVKFVSLQPDGFLAWPCLMVLPSLALSETVLGRASGC